MKHAAILFFSILLFSICLGQGSLNNGLALHLPMDGNTTDVSGNAHQPIVRNISFGSNCSGIASQAAYFNGNNSMLEIPASIALNSTEKLTISFWVKTETNATQTIFSRAKAIPGEDPKYGYALELNTSKQPLFSMVTPPLCHIYTNWISDPTPMPTQTWTSIIVIFDGVQLSIYTNGILTGQSFTSFDKLSFCQADLPLFIGAIYADQQQTFKGWIDDFRIYNRAITEVELRVLSNTCTINPFCPAPSNVSINGTSETSVLLNWTTASNSNNVVSEYRVTGSNNWLPGFQTINTSASIINLQVNNNYELRIRSACGASDSSGWKTATYLLRGNTNCDSPFNLQVANTTETSASLTWEVLPTGIGVNVQYAEEGTDNWIDAAAEITDRAVTITGLNPGTSYVWRIQTACNLGPSSWVLSQFTTTGVSPCRTPEGLLPFDLSGNRAALQWNAGAEVQFFEVEYKLTTATTWIRANVQQLSETRIYIDSLQPLTAYQWRVRSICATGTSGWTNGDFITTPGQPIDFGIQLVANFEHVSINCKPAEISFKNTSIVNRTNVNALLWNFGDGETSTTPEPIHVYDKPGNYTVSLTIADPDGRTSAKVQQVKIQSTKLKLAVTGADVITCSKEPVSLKADGGKTYQWSPCTGLSDCTSPTPLVIPGMHDRYTVRVTDRNGCTDTASVIVRYVDPAKDIFIPNAFTPNGDGLNDTFKPLANIGIPGPHEVQIVNRFGSKVFASSNPLIGWDGTTQGKPAPTGTYSYLIRVKGEGKCATKNITGTVMLIR